MRRSLFIGALLAVFAGGVAMLNRPYGPIALEQASAVLERRVAAELRQHGSYARLELVRADGTADPTAADAVSAFRPVDCPIRNSNAGGVHGRWAGPTIHRATTYACLFEAVVGADGSDDSRYLGLLVTRSSHPDLAPLGGYDTHLLEASQTAEMLADRGIGGS